MVARLLFYFFGYPSLSPTDIKMFYYLVAETYEGWQVDKTIMLSALTQLELIKKKQNFEALRQTETCIWKF